jgi:HlyD family secretion protein
MTPNPSSNGLLAFLVLALSFLGGCETRAARFAGDPPQAEVQQGDLQLRIATTGLLKSSHTYPITAPPVGGALLQILRLPRTGTSVRKDEGILEFDISQQRYNLEQSRNDLAQADQEILKATADAEIQTAQDTTDLLKARFAVRKAELDVSKNEILSEIDGKKNLLALEEARRALAQLETDINSHAASNRAGLLVSREKQNKAKLAMKQALENIESMKVKAAASGILVLHRNDSATGGMFFSGMTLPDYQVGDQVGPGTTVADVVDVGEMEIDAQVDEIDRPMLKAGQAAEVRVDAIPGETFPGKISDITVAVSQEFWRVSARSKFGVTVRLDHPDARLRPGFTANLVLLGDHLTEVNSVPRQAVFDSGEKKIVYVKRHGAWEQKEVKVRTYSGGRAVIEGLPVGAVVALSNPERAPRQGGRQGNDGATGIVPAN